MHPTCRLCESDTLPVFSKKQLGKYQVQYFRCSTCHSLQTQSPIWIDEAHQHHNLKQEIGLVKRTMFNARLVLALALKRKFDRKDVIIDFGGGTGLLTRLIRDFGLNGFWSDKYAENLFAIGFERDVTTIKEPKLITAFQVFEHLVYPAEEIQNLIKRQPDFLLFSTRLYQGEGREWRYLLEDGQRVQFYSHQALASLAKKYDYYFSTDRQNHHLFSKEKISPKLCEQCCEMAASPMIESQCKWSSRTEEDAEAFFSCAKKSNF